MIERVRISPAVVRQEDLLRQQVLAASLPFEKSLNTYRTRLVNSIAKGLKDYPPTEWEQWAAEQVKEPYLKKWYPQLYMAAGKPAVERAIRSFLSIKGTEEMNTWEKALYDWIGAEMGNKIVLVSGTLKEWTINTIMQYLDEHSGEGVEKIVAGVEDYIREVWKDARTWQIRRIVQTESLTAMSEAADVAIKGLNIKFKKTWGISGQNTRPAHQAMNGVTVGQHDLFNVDGELLEFPRDGKHGASAGNIINCRCFCIRKPLNDRGQLITDDDLLAMI